MLSTDQSVSYPEFTVNVRPGVPKNPSAAASSIAASSALAGLRDTRTSIRNRFGKFASAISCVHCHFFPASSDSPLALPFVWVPIPSRTSEMRLRATHSAKLFSRNRSAEVAADVSVAISAPMPNATITSATRTSSKVKPAATRETPIRSWPAGW